jgi:di/tricarboxylate transporter
MTFDQTAIIVLLVALLALLASDRLRMEIAALAALGLAFVLGLVPPDRVFAGFSHPAVITVVEILILIRSLQSTHVLDAFALGLARRFKSRRAVVAFLCTTGALASVFMNNVGALALMFPIAFSLCARARIDPAAVLMPLSFATLLGGLCSIIGTPANLIVHDAYASVSTQGFSFFDFGRVGAPVAAAGLLLLVFWPASSFSRDLEATRGLDDGARLICEVLVCENSAWIGRALREIDQEISGRVHGVIRHGSAVFQKRLEITAESGDVLLLECDTASLRRPLAMRDIAELETPDSPGAAEAEAVVAPNSMLVGSRLAHIAAFEGEGVRVRGVVTRGWSRKLEGRFHDFQLSAGDVLLLSGKPENLVRATSGAGLLSLTPGAPIGPASAGFPALAAFAGAVVLTALMITPPEISFGLAVLALAFLGRLDIRGAVREVNWPIILTLAAMIPMGEAIQRTGAAHLLAGAILNLLPLPSPILICAVILVTAVLITPFVNNASAAVILSPIAIELAQATGTPVPAALVAVAIGVSLDFLTPFGHHNNTIVMGAAGYRFLDFPRLGAPLLAVTIPVAVFMIAITWL